MREVKRVTYSEDEYFKDIPGLRGGEKGLGAQDRGIGGCKRCPGYAAGDAQRFCCCSAIRWIACNSALLANLNWQRCIFPAPPLDPLMSWTACPRSRTHVPAPAILPHASLAPCPFQSTVCALQAGVVAAVGVAPGRWTRRRWRP